MMLENKKFKCSCQDKLISSPDLAKHMKLTGNHNIKPFSANHSPLKQKQKSESQLNLNYSIKKLFTETHICTMNITLKFMKPIFDLTNLLRSFNELFPIESRYQNLAINSVESFNIDITTKKIEKLLGNIPIKEITSFKNLKKNFKIKMMAFARKVSMEVLSLAFYDKFMLT